MEVKVTLQEVLFAWRKRRKVSGPLAKVARKRKAKCPLETMKNYGVLG